VQRRLAPDRRTTGLLVLLSAVLGWPAARGGSRTLVGVSSRRWCWPSAVLVSGLEAGGWGVWRATDLILVVLIVLGVLVRDRRRRFCAETSRCGREQLLCVVRSGSVVLPSIVWCLVRCAGLTIVDLGRLGARGWGGGTELPTLAGVAVGYRSGVLLPMVVAPLGRAVSTDVTSPPA